MQNIDQTDNEQDADRAEEAAKHAVSVPRQRGFRAQVSAGLVAALGKEARYSGDPEDLGDNEFGKDVEPHGGCEADPSQRPGHHIMDRVAITKAIEASNFDGSFDALSSAEEQRVRMLLHYRRLSLFRPHVIGDPAMIAKLDLLGLSAPNFAALTRLVVRAAHVSHATGTPLRLPPVLAVGEPGIGKSRYARSLAAALGTSCEVINGSTLPDVGSLTGYPPVWRGAGPGRVAKAIVSSSTSGPLLFVDECEKIVDYEASTFPLDRLLTVLEGHTAATFQDEHLQVPMRADRVLWLFAANSIDALSAPFLDRVLTVHVPRISQDQRDAVLVSMLAEVGQELGLAVTLASPDVLTPLRRLGLRRSRLAFEIAIASAVEKNRRFLTLEDIGSAVTLLDTAKTQEPIGFFPARNAIVD